MSCEQELQTQSYLDGELDGEAAQATERHLQTCAECSALASQSADLSDALRKATRHQAPEFLRHRIRAALAREAAPVRKGVFWWGAASGVGASALAAALALFVLLPPAAASLAESVTDAHARALSGGQVIAVASSNHHVVKPWLAAHAGISPPATDFAAQGYVLAGGRVDRIAGASAAVTVYRHGNHELDLFAWPDKGAVLPSQAMVRGFRLAFWKQGDLDFAAISDMDEAAFQKFTALARE